MRCTGRCSTHSAAWTRDRRAPHVAAVHERADGACQDASTVARTFKTAGAARHIGGMEGLPGFLLAGVALAGSPGPATLSLAAAGAAFGARRVVGYLAGIVVGMVGVMAITASGLVGLLLAVPGATPVVTVAAAVYFVWLAWRIATAPPLAAEGGERKPPSFLGGLRAVAGQSQGLCGDGGAVLGLRAAARAAGARCGAEDRAADGGDRRGQRAVAAAPAR